MTTERSNSNPNLNPHPDTVTNQPRVVQFVRYSDGDPLPQGWLVRYHPHTDRWTATYDQMPIKFATTREEVEEGVRADAQSLPPEPVRASAAAAPAAPEADPKRDKRVLVWAAVGGLTLSLLGVAAGTALAGQTAPEPVVEKIMPEACQQALVAADVMGDTARSVQVARGAADSPQFSYQLAQMVEWGESFNTARHACNEALGY